MLFPCLFLLFPCFSVSLVIHLLLISPSSPPSGLSSYSSIRPYESGLWVLLNIMLDPRCESGSRLFSSPRLGSPAFLSLLISFLLFELELLLLLPSFLALPLSPSSSSLSCLSLFSVFSAIFLWESISGHLLSLLFLFLVYSSFLVLTAFCFMRCGVCWAGESITC
eukprot:NODE_731_length_721_cov_166.980655_g665_i0.p1 GENE.NODE_731_length_721_cov_166.980655_g665_i0~~NODE_731_length_721_cov_166.980655_g665_i0.p1  ORF type:complete len:166 (-),score=31.26 NODE_731_length_721_cov_166.980655_g665_i0:119-616(-)